MIVNPTLKEIVGDSRTATILYIRKGYVYYTVYLKDLWWMFPVDLSDIGDATLNESEKAITLMRYIRKSLDEGIFVKAILPQYMTDLINRQSGLSQP